MKAQLSTEFLFLLCMLCLSLLILTSAAHSAHSEAEASISRFRLTEEAENFAAFADSLSLGGASKTTHQPPSTKSAPATAVLYTYEVQLYEKEAI